MELCRVVYSVPLNVPFNVLMLGGLAIVLYAGLASFGIRFSTVVLCVRSCAQVNVQNQVATQIAPAALSDNSGMVLKRPVFIARLFVMLNVHQPED